MSGLLAAALALQIVPPVIGPLVPLPPGAVIVGPETASTAIVSDLYPSGVVPTGVLQPTVTVVVYLGCPLQAGCDAQAVLP